MVLTTLSFSEDSYLEGKVLLEKLKALQMIDSLKKNKNPDDIVIMANVVGADELLKRISKLDGKVKIKNMILVFPDVDVLMENMEVVSKKVKKLAVVLINKKVEDKNIKNRDLETFVEKGGNKIVKRLKNVKIYEVNLMDEDLSKIYKNSLTKSFFEDEINQKYIVEIYELEKK